MDAVGEHALPRAGRDGGKLGCSEGVAGYVHDELAEFEAADSVSDG